MNNIEKKIKIGDIEITNGVLLAPMEGVTDIPFRVVCRRLGADLVYSEFIAAEALIRDAKKSFDKIKIAAEERPTAIQIFGSKVESMAHAAKIAEDCGADILDINYGCWVKKVVNGNAGAALMKDPSLMFDITKACVEAVNIPVTVKTRLGWDKNSINVFEIAKMQEEAGAKAITIHCRTREMGMSGEADWSYIPRIKEHINIPLILNGDIKNAHDALRAMQTEGADAIMIGRGCVGNPFIFREAKRLIDLGQEPEAINVKERIDACLGHLDLMIEHKGLSRGIKEFRKHYSGYLRGMYNNSKARQVLVVTDEYEEIKNILADYYQMLVDYDKLEAPVFDDTPKVMCRNDIY